MIKTRNRVNFILQLKYNTLGFIKPTQIKKILFQINYLTKMQNAGYDVLRIIQCFGKSFQNLYVLNTIDFLKICDL